MSCEQFKGCKPIGPLAEILQEYEAPPKAQKEIAKRVGAFIGSYIPFSKIEHTIQRSMDLNRGLPDWEDVGASLGKITNALYKGSRRRIL